MRVRIKVRDILLKAELFDNLKTTRAVAESLPIKGIVKRWGDEIYFETPSQLISRKIQKRLSMWETSLTGYPEGRYASSLGRLR